jgi:hypothetical protein
MKNFDIISIEEELKKCLDNPYEWGRKQNDVWDKKSNFIYEIKDYETLKMKISEVSKNNDLNKLDFCNYSSNRWYNFWSAMAVEQIFTQIEGIQANINSKNRLIDFNFFGIDFDHKTSVFPYGFGQKLEFAQKDPEKLIDWLYKNQSVQQRQHFENRLFLIVYSKKGQHWKLKAEISWLKLIIEKYVATFENSQLKRFDFHPGKRTFSDIIWAIK